VFLLRASALAAVVVMIASLGVWALRGRRPATVVDSPVARQAEPISDKQETQKPPVTPERTVASTERAAEPPAASRRPAPPPPPPSGEAPRQPARQPATTPAREIALASTPALSVRAPAASTPSTNNPDASGQPVLPLHAAQPAPRRSPSETTALAASSEPEPVIETASRPAVVDRSATVLPSPVAPMTATRPNRYDIAAATFSESDADVTPPVPDSSQQLWLMPASPRKSDQIRIEILVDERGSVQAVRARDRTDSLADAAALTMSLSAVKSWHFTPALKDGRPVKFRLNLTLTIH